jgi:hypothetical protein
MSVTNRLTIELLGVIWKRMQRPINILYLFSKAVFTRLVQPLPMAMKARWLMAGGRQPTRPWISSAVKISFYLRFIILLSFFVSMVAVAQRKNDFSCSSDIEAEIWSLWDGTIRNHFQQHLLRNRLLQQGDVYALYDIQTFSHNAVAMARRCGRTKRLAEMGRVYSQAYRALSQDEAGEGGRRWICRGGKICNKTNGQIDKEVMLASVQFLGLAASVANALALSSDLNDPEAESYIAETVRVLSQHLLQWGDTDAIERARQNARARPDDVKDGSSSLFFTDKPLWQIAIYAELAGILHARERRMPDLGRTIDARDRARMRTHLEALLQFFTSRLSYRNAPGDSLHDHQMADVDRGFWRLYPDGRYAGYEGESKPVVCSAEEPGARRVRPLVRVPAETVERREDTGWDLSHARRLVHALDALERNGQAMKVIFALSDKQLPSPQLPKAFANQLIGAVWNGDAAKPLFSNFLSGANGWYRVAYDNGTGECVEGFKPFGLSDAFPTGGYLAWARYKPMIGQLGRQLYWLSESTEPDAVMFMERYYTALSPSAGKLENAIARFMFLPSLIGAMRK